MFGVYICISNFLFGCIQAGWPCYYAQTFGPELGSLLYPFFFTASCFANFIIALIVYELQKLLLGHTGMMYLTTASSAIAFLIILFMNSEVFESYDDGPLISEPSHHKTTPTAAGHGYSIYDKGRVDFTLIDC